jgi:hypothetical protein
MTFVLPQELKSSFSSQHCAGMYAGLQREIGLQCSFYIVIRDLLHMASHNSLGNNSKGVTIGFAKIHFG